MPVSGVYSMKESNSGQYFMSFIKKNFHGSFILIVCIFAVFNTNVSAKTDLIISGNVVAGAIQKGAFLFGTFVLPLNTLVVKVKTIKKGSVRSKYLLVQYASDKRFDESQFGLQQTFDFKLKREKFCDAPLVRYMFYQERLENGLVIRTVPVVEIKVYAAMVSLSPKLVMPCYWIVN